MCVIVYVSGHTEGLGSSFGRKAVPKAKVDRPRRSCKPSLKVRENREAMASEGRGRGSNSIIENLNATSKPGSSSGTITPLSAIGKPRGCSSPKDEGRAVSSSKVNSRLVDVNGVHSAAEVHNEKDLSSCLEQAFLGLAQTLRQPQLPTIEPEVFSGDLMSFPRWELQIQEFIDSLEASSYKKLQILSRYVAGEAKETIKALLTIPSGSCYEKARTTLQRRFGNQIDIAEAFRNQLNSWQPIEDGDGHGLRKLADFLEQINVAMESLPSLAILNDGYENRSIAMKLPHSVASQWARKVANARREGQYPPFDEFVSFVSAEAQVLCDPLVLTLNSKRRKSSPQTKRKTVHQTAAKEQQDKKKTPCSKCSSEEHRTRECEALESLTHEQLNEFIREFRLCFGCLGKGHISKDCKSKITCQQCGENHATTWHGKRKGTPKEVVCNEVLKTSAAPSGLTAMIVPVYIATENDLNTKLLTYALLDTQSDACFGTTSVLSDLGTSRKKVQLKIATITNESRRIDSTSHKGLRVRGLKGEKWVALPEVFEHDNIPANRDHIPTTKTIAKFPHLRNLKGKLSPLLDVEVGLLIGYNCPEAIAPIVSVVGEGARPYGVKTALGWSVVGQSRDATDTDSVGQSHRILTTQCAELEDVHYIHAVGNTKVRELPYVPPQCEDISKALGSDFSERQENDSLRSNEDILIITPKINSLNQKLREMEKENKALQQARDKAEQKRQAA